MQLGNWNKLVFKSIMLDILFSKFFASSKKVYIIPTWIKNNAEEIQFDKNFAEMFVKSELNKKIYKVTA